MTGQTRMMQKLCRDYNQWFFLEKYFIKAIQVTFFEMLKTLVSTSSNTVLVWSRKQLRYCSLFVRFVDAEDTKTDSNVGCLVQNVAFKCKSTTQEQLL